MGLEMARIDLPYVQRMWDRHGKVRHYFRRKGSRRVTLPGLPGSSEFMEAYQRAVGQEPKPVASERTKAGSLKALCVSYYASADFRVLSEATRKNYRRILERFCASLHHTGVPHGDLPAAAMRRKHIKRVMDDMVETPEAAANLLKRLRAVFLCAIENEEIEHSPCVGVKPPKNKSDGHRPWTDADLAKWCETYPSGSRERLAFMLLLHTTQRRGDVVTLGRQHLKGDSAFRYTQEKTGEELVIQIHPDLKAELDLVPKTQMTFILTEYGKPFSGPGFTNWIRKRAKAAGLPPRSSPHGLRKAGARLLAEAQCSASEIASVTGHRTLKEVERYTKSADQERLAKNAMAKLVGQRKNETR